MTHPAILFVGDRHQLSDFMKSRGIPDDRHGKSVFWARNGPEHLHRAHGRIEIVKQRDYEMNEHEVAAVTMAKRFNYEEDRL